MGKQSSSAPPQISGQQMAQQQTTGNIQTAAANSYLNAINQNTPYGQTRWREVGKREMGNGVTIPIWEVDQTLSPEQQDIYQRQAALSSGALQLGSDYLGKIRTATANPFNYEGLPDAPTYNDQFRQDQANKIVARNQNRMDADQRALAQRLADQGIGIQDPAYRAAMDQYQRGVNDFRLGADLQAGQEATNAFNLAAQTRDRAINERLQERTQPISEFGAMLGYGQQGVRQPSYVNTQQQPIANTDYVGANMAAYQQAAQQQQMAQQSNNAMMGGLFGLGSAGIGAAGMYFGGAAML